MNTQTVAAETLTRRTYMQLSCLAVIWLLVGILYVPMIQQWIQIRTHDKQFAESLQNIAQVAGKEGRSTDELRAMLLARAKQLSVPVRSSEVLIHGSASVPKVTVYYDAGIIVPILNWPAYFFRFNHNT